MDSICQNILYYPNKHTLGMLLTPDPSEDSKGVPSEQDQLPLWWKFKKQTLIHIET